MNGIINSRTLYFPTKLDKYSEVGALVPLYDMANHQDLDIDYFSYFYYDDIKQSYILKAYKDF